MADLSFEMEIMAKVSWFIFMVSPLMLIKDSVLKRKKYLVMFSIGLCLFISSLIVMIIPNNTGIDYSYIAFLPMVLSTLMILPLYCKLPKVESKTFLCTAIAICIGLLISTLASTTTNKEISLKLISDTYKTLVIEKVSSEDSSNEIVNACYVESSLNGDECKKIMLDESSYLSGKSTAVLFEDKSYNIKEYISFSVRDNTHIKIIAFDTKAKVQTTHIYKNIPNQIENNNLASISLIVLVISSIWGSLSWFVHIFHKSLRNRRLKP